MSQNEPNGEQAPNPADNSTAFYAGFQDAELRGFLETKGFKAPEELAKSYRNLEGHMGVPPERLLKLPEKADSPEWDGIRQKLGYARPESADKYEIAPAEGMPVEYANKVKEWAFELNIPNHMLKSLGEKQNAYIAEVQEQMALEAQRNSEQELSNLKSEWGNKFESSVELARRASREMMSVTGMTDTDLSSMEDALGTAKFMKFWAKLGSQTQQEGEMIKGDENTGFGISPDVAKHKISILKQDPEWFARWSNGGAKEVQEWEYLNRVASGA